MQPAPSEQVLFAVSMPLLALKIANTDVTGAAMPKGTEGPGLH